MTTFDPDRHHIIARDRDTGEHVHVPLPDLAREVRDYDDTSIRQGLVALESRIGTAPPLLTPEVQSLLLLMADKINALELKAFDLEMRLDPVEQANRMLAAEAARRVGEAA